MKKVAGNMGYVALSLALDLRVPCLCLTHVLACGFLDSVARKRISWSIEFKTQAVENLGKPQGKGCGGGGNAGDQIATGLSCLTTEPKQRLKP